jgi:hypothetical protein
MRPGEPPQQRCRTALRRATAAGRTAVAGLLLSLLAAGGGPALGHIVIGTTTINLLTTTSDLIVRARVVDADAVLLLEDHGLREALVVAEVLEVLKGAPVDGPLRFVQHGHGVAKYEKGEEVVVFLQRIERIREFGRSPLVGHVDWVSLQESDAKFPLGPDTRAHFVAAVRAYAALGELPVPEARIDGRRRITVELLGSPDPTLARSALRDVVLARDAPILTAEDLPLLVPLLESAKTPIGIRVGLLAELERRGLVDAPPRWAKLLRTTTGSDRFSVVRAAAAHPSEPVNAELLRLLANDDRQLVAAAAVSLGVPGNDTAVAPLAKLLADEQARVRMAAIRGIGRIATPEAKRTLAEAAESHPEARTRRRAAAEIVRLDRHEAPVQDAAKTESAAPSP